MGLLPDVSAADWPALHAQDDGPWQDALAALGAAWGWTGDWERMGGGEDWAGFARADVLVKPIPPCAPGA